MCVMSRSISIFVHKKTQALDGDFNDRAEQILCIEKVLGFYPRVLNFFLNFSMSQNKNILFKKTNVLTIRTKDRNYTFRCLL